MKVVQINIPIPPSVNRAYYNAPGAGRRKASCYRQWEASALASLWPQKPAGGFPFFETGFEVHITVPLNMRGDVDNRVKLALDFLKKPAGIISDDKHVVRASIARSETVPADTCRIAVYDASTEPSVRPVARAA